MDGKLIRGQFYSFAVRNDLLSFYRVHVHCDIFIWVQIEHSQLSAKEHVMVLVSRMDRSGANSVRNQICSKQAPGKPCAVLLLLLQNDTVELEESQERIAELIEGLEWFFKTLLFSDYKSNMYSL